MVGKIEEVPHEVRPMQYLYAAGQERVFMDSETFEQYSVREDALAGGLTDKAGDVLVLFALHRKITDVVAPLDAWSGQNLHVEWTATNAGGATASELESLGEAVRDKVFLRTSSRC